MTGKNNPKLREDFQRAFKFCRFEEKKSFEDARQEAIRATCAIHGGSIHDHGDEMNLALRDLCLNYRELWVVMYGQRITGGFSIFGKGRVDVTILLGSANDCLFIPSFS